MSEVLIEDEIEVYRVPEDGVVAEDLGVWYFPKDYLRRHEEEKAACRDIDRKVFFPTSGSPYMTANAKKVCAECPIRERCLDVAIANNEDGVWGGTTEPERRKIRKQRERDAQVQQPATA